MGASKLDRFIMLHSFLQVTEMVQLTIEIYTFAAKFLNENFASLVEVQKCLNIPTDLIG